MVGERRLVWAKSELNWRDYISYDTWAVSNVTGVRARIRQQ